METHGLFYYNFQPGKDYSDFIKSLSIVFFSKDTDNPHYTHINPHLKSDSEVNLHRWKNLINKFS